MFTILSIPILMLAMLVGLLYVQRLVFVALAILLLYLVGFLVFGWQREYGSAPTSAYVNFILQLLLAYAIGILAGVRARFWIQRGMPS